LTHDDIVRAEFPDGRLGRVEVVVSPITAVERDRAALVSPNMLDEVVTPLDGPEIL
jgi:hypothetical protein